MECSGQLRIKRFGNPGYIGHDGKPWDGIHMRGRLAIRHYTNSVIRILSDICQTKSKSPQQPFHSTCPQVESRQQRNYRTAESFQSQRKYKNNYWHKQTPKAGNIQYVPQDQYQSQSDHSQRNTGQFTFPKKFRKAPNVNSEGISSQYGSHYYSIPVQNRYSENF